MMTRSGRCVAPEDNKELEKLLLSMEGHFIPRRWVRRVAKTLGIKKIADIDNMQLETVRLAPQQFWEQIIDLRNFHKGDDATMWSVPEEWFKKAV